MNAAIADILPLAVAIALFPIPILAVILMLLSSRSSANVPAFLAGWVVGLATVVIAVALFTDGYTAIANDDADEGIGWVRVTVGLLLLLFALKKWLGRPDPASDADVPGWLSAIGGFSAVKALGAGLALTMLNPKNIALAASAGTAVGGPYVTAVEGVVVGVLFVVLSTLGVLAPVVYSAVGGPTARRTLDNGRAWLVANHNVVMTALMVIIGAVLIGEGLRLL